MRPFLEYGAGYWEPYRKCQVNALDLVQKKAAKFANNREIRSGKHWHIVKR